MREKERWLQQRSWGRKIRDRERGEEKEKERIQKEKGGRSFFEGFSGKKKGGRKGKRKKRGFSRRGEQRF